jgi:tRNA (guanine10-N2)-dimethyltransferase
VLGAVRIWKGAGGRIDLEQPDCRFWLVADAAGSDRWLEEVGGVDRRAFTARRISTLPFQRPVGLAPRLARAAANLARVTSGSCVIDPFLGTGALLAEAALLGARVVGIDRDPRMVQGALQNFAHLGVEAEELVVGDSGEVELRGSEGPFDAVLSDLPYGRASGTGGEEAAHLAHRVIPRWAERVRPGGRVVLVVAGGEDPLSAPWQRVVSVPVRVHRSLTREFRVYERAR